MYMKCYPIYKEEIIYNNFLNLLDWRFLLHTVIYSAPLTLSPSMATILQRVPASDRTPYNSGRTQTPLRSHIKTQQSTSGHK